MICTFNIIIIILYKGLKIVGHESSLPHGSSVHLSCSTDLDADTIEWLDAKGSELRTGSGPSLELTDTPSGITNVVLYICRINSTFGSQNKTANVHILQEEASSSDSLIIIAIVVIVIALVIVVIVIIVVILLMR